MQKGEAFVFWKNNKTKELQPILKENLNAVWGKDDRMNYQWLFVTSQSSAAERQHWIPFIIFLKNPFLSNRVKQNIVKGLIFTEIFPVKLDLVNPYYPSHSFFFFQTVSNQCLITWLLHGTTFETLLIYWGLEVHHSECSTTLDVLLVLTKLRLEVGKVDCN